MNELNDPMYWCEVLIKIQSAQQKAMVNKSYHLSLMRRYYTMKEASSDTTFPFWAFYYSKNVIKCRWIEAEEYISEYEMWWPVYCKEFNIERVK